MLDLISHAFYTIWMFLCEHNHQVLLVRERLHFTVDNVYPHLLSLWERIQVIVDNHYNHLVLHLAIFRKVPLYIEHTLGEPFIYYNGILAIIFGTVVLLVLFSRALVGVAKNIGIAMFKFKSADSQLLKQVETSERAAIVLQSAWRRKQAQTSFLHSLVYITMVQSVVRRYLSKGKVQEVVKSRQIRARFDRDFKPVYGKHWRGIASNKEEYNDTNSSPVETRQYAESDAPAPEPKLTKKERREAARRNAQQFGIRHKARLDAARQENSKEEEKDDCFSDLSEEEDFLALMKDLRATETIRMSTLFRGIADIIADRSLE
ncbi:hypothetical protein FRACYDRAFT_235422 [Fragilariopsis cylindrus CCMP1102]|uniref:Uncharacterized protein n=1 Tax=Fragilariopsis cylindrus CCMP1102 TaxID=635003 RepID=A0A1E7FMG8_9STRA|nr:hypothetical protein FRACYDRAFT_235422 [Fragilariopsis cylindrus CCMP1102]|eukprot:OEU19372.1 hypothetical protein FRACYDRAFT_235422 [Fragilariopsis cylindrus CCMP1102]